MALGGAPGAAAAIGAGAASMITQQDPPWPSEEWDSAASQIG